MGGAKMGVGRMGRHGHWEHFALRDLCHFPAKRLCSSDCHGFMRCLLCMDQAHKCHDHSRIQQVLSALLMYLHPLQCFV